MLVLWVQWSVDQLGAAFSQGPNVANLANARAMVNIYEAMGTEQAKRSKVRSIHNLRTLKYWVSQTKLLMLSLVQMETSRLLKHFKAAGIEVDSKLRDEELDEFLEGLKKDTSARDKLRSKYVPKAKPTPPTTTTPSSSDDDGGPSLAEKIRGKTERKGI